MKVCFVALNKQNKKYIENCTNDIKNKIYSSVEKSIFYLK